VNCALEDDAVFAIFIIFATSRIFDGDSLISLTTYLIMNRPRTMKRLLGGISLATLATKLITARDPKKQTWTANENQCARAQNSAGQDVIIEGQGPCCSRDTARPCNMNEIHNRSSCDRCSEVLVESRD